MVCYGIRYIYLMVWFAFVYPRLLQFPMNDHHVPILTIPAMLTPPLITFRLQSSAVDRLGGAWSGLDGHGF